MIPSITLSNGYRIPRMGFGTFRMAPEDTMEAVKCAIEAGWRHIDTAAVYGNEKEVGLAVRESGLPRKQIFVTSKLWNADRGYDSALRAFDQTLERMGFDYLDLYLIHWPASPFFHDDWKTECRQLKALERLLQRGSHKGNRASNFMPRHINELLKTAEIKPMVNQIEFHPDGCKKNVPISVRRRYCT